VKLLKMVAYKRINKYILECVVKIQ
jgi:hypothetical protein